DTLLSWVWVTLLPIVLVHWVVFVRRKVSRRSEIIGVFIAAVLAAIGWYRTEHFFIAILAAVGVVGVAWMIWRYIQAERHK
ncbi:MAG: hypothetical protein ACR2PM_04160, partial [Hyphomicrobiales bacterium]